MFFTFFLRRICFICFFNLFLKISGRSLQKTHKVRGTSILSILTLCSSAWYFMEAVTSAGPHIFEPEFQAQETKVPVPSPDSRKA